MKFNQDYCVIGDLNLQKGIFIKKAVSMIEERLSKVGNRKTLITQHGFDTKFASNLIRLLLEGKELVSTGEIVFPLTYKQTILDIIQNQNLDRVNIFGKEREKASFKAPLLKKSNGSKKPKKSLIQFRHNFFPFSQKI